MDIAGEHNESPSLRRAAAVRQFPSLNSDHHAHGHHRQHKKDHEKNHVGHLMLRNAIAAPSFEVVHGARATLDKRRP
jgi:hypothetical protein